MAHTPQFTGSDSTLRNLGSTLISSGQQLSRKKKVNNIVLSMPGRSEYQLISVTPGMAFHVDFDLSRVTLDRLGHDIYLYFEEDATIVLQRISELEGSSQAPVFFLPDGTLSDLDIFNNLLNNNNMMTD